MNTWTRVIRTDRNNLMERVCPHGIGHPDPDSMEWLHRIGFLMTASMRATAAARKDSPGTTAPSGTGTGSPARSIT
jgi:hypothetical protein